jgi:putative DNA primase/helicase
MGISIDSDGCGVAHCFRCELVESHHPGQSHIEMTLMEREANRQRIKALQVQREAEETANQRSAAAKAAKCWQQATPCTEHPYLTTKGVKGNGVRIDAAGGLIVPILDTADTLQSLQTISPNGEKRFLPGGKVKSCYHTIGKPKGGRLIVCEGYATGASIHEATGEAVTVAFNAGNLKEVALALHAKHPALKITIAADDDHLTDGNPGITKATAAAQAVGGCVAVPDFRVSRPEWATDFNDLHQMEGLNAVRRCISAAQSAPVPAWPEPQPLIAQLDPEDYPLDALPAIVQQAVMEVSGFVKAPVPLISTSALAALSLAIQAYVDVERAEKLDGPTGLFLLAIADSGERKSTCDGFFTRAIRDYEAAQQELAKSLMQDYRSAHDAWEAQRSGLKEKIKSLTKEGKPSSSQVQELHDLDLNEPQPPRVPRLIYGDATPEALAYSLANCWPSGGVVSSEAGSVFGSHGMGKESVMRNLAMLNQLWDGASLPVERRSTESYIVRGARLTMALQVQESTLRAFFDSTKGLARGTGFLARFLVSWPRSTQGTRYFTDAPAQWPSLTAFNDRLSAILNQPAPIDEDGALTPAMLTLSADAKAAWVAFHDAIEAELSTGGELHDVRDVASKTADNAARLAALLHTFTGSIGPISVDAMESASRIAAWHLHEARRFLGELALPTELANPARLESWLLDYCRRECTNTVSTRDIQRCGPQGLRDKAVIDSAIKELSELGRAKLVLDGKKKAVQINPTLLREMAV